MKPIGSITNIFPFIEPETRQIIDSFINESKNFADFAERFCKYVLSNDSSEMMVFLAWHFALDTINYQKIQQLFDRFSEYSYTRPWFIWWGMTIKNLWSWKILLKEVEEAISSTTNPWIKLNLFSLKQHGLRGIASDYSEEEKVIQNMTELIQQNEQLEWARSRIFNYFAVRYTGECNYKQAFIEYDKALQHSLAYDDISYLAGLKTSIAERMGRLDPTKGLEIINSTSKILEELGYLDRDVALFNITGLILDARGEYNAAVRSFEEALERQEKLHAGLSLRVMPSYISRSYRRMGKYVEALEWAKISLDSKPMISPLSTKGQKVFGNLNMTAALALLGKIEEAESYYEIASELILNSGTEVWLSDMYLCRGLIDRSVSNFKDALFQFEMALEIVERLRRQVRINECLLRLAETEIQLQLDESPEKETILALHWTARMENMAREMDLPGILGLALQLKAKVLLHQKKDNAAQDILLQVREISKNPGTRFLQERE